MNPISPTSIPLERYRENFFGLGNKFYFNYGGQGPLPRSALLAIQQSYEQIQQLGPFSGKVNTWIVEETERTRRAIATELKTPPETITLTENVSVGCNIALWGMDWQAGDHLLISDCEHHSVIAAVKEIQRRFQIEVSLCPLRSTLNAGDPIATLASYLRPHTRLVALSHILWNTGQLLPLEEMVQVCHDYASDRPIRVLVDAAQSVGVLPLNLTELQADFYAFTGHKWWCGPEGLGGLYVRPEAGAELHPTFIGWRSTVTDSAGYPTGWKSDGRRYEVATSAYPLYAGLREAIALHPQWGNPMERYQRILALSRLLWQKLVAVPGVTCLRTQPPEAGLVSFQISPQSHQQMVQFLETRDILIRIILDLNCVRACVHYFTLESEIDQLVAAVQEFTN
ncbi:aminotransferase class V-fold PLP-dependent enzyme [Kovacikia minuta CCNUW1]|uniref:aminotransferase class V-fold PLP-dependent enzyme n=1 Tax=Kovacikia minuta TaxID=2931930 RepID=UPI001CCB4C09|nr:aminotransferase class V-fold PLP-dependent enzyme [Kovacikia minuta]UBF26195.1 aminotransferase class V-fold PLP-dependent enzyme [Kovacikia minuta CCNUW1]